MQQRLATRFIISTCRIQGTVISAPAMWNEHGEHAVRLSTTHARTFEVLVPPHLLPAMRFGAQVTLEADLVATDEAQPTQYALRVIRAL